MDYRKSAKEILLAIGGKENLASAAHCSTRLRLIIGDNAKIDKETLENIESVDLSEVPDETFAQEILGKGCAIIPSDNIITAPADAVVETIFDAHHAVGLKLENGCEILIHVGINTVELKGQGFTAHVSEGDKVTVGQTLITFDREFIQKNGYNIITPILVTNADDYKDVKKAVQGDVTHGEKLIEVSV